MRSSPLGITVEADPETFDRTFRQSSRMRDEWFLERKPGVPDQLQNQGSDLVFPQPVKLFSRQVTTI